MKSERSGNNSFLKKLIVMVLLLSSIYLIIALINLIPFGINFLCGKYYVNDNLFPNYSNVFNSIFTIISIIISSCFSWMLYKINNEQKNNNYNLNIASPASAIYLIIKFNLLSDLIEILNLEENKSIFKNEKYKDKNGQVCEASDIFSDKWPRVNTEKVEEYLFKIIGDIEDIDLKKVLFALVQDVSDGRNITLTMLETGLIDTKKNIIIETSGKKWLRIFYDIYGEGWNYLDNDYKIVMKRLQEMSRSRK